MLKTIKDLYSYRELLKTNVKKEIRGKYKGAWLGIIWSYLNPLLMLLVYSLVFSQILRINIPNYTMFLFTALIPWNFFTTTISQGADAVVSNGNILKKVYFPREILPISVVTSNVVNFLISCIIMIFFILITGIGISKYILFFPLILLIQYILLLGITFIISAITVYVRDLEHIIGVFLLAMFYATPIVYSIEMVPKSLKFLISLNPMTLIIGAYRNILFYQKMPYLKDLGIIALASLILLFLGIYIFKKLQKRFAEEL